MNKKLYGIVALVLTLAFWVTGFAGCAGERKSVEGQETSTQAQGTSAQAEDKNYWDLLDTASDSSELPDWAGEKLKLKQWYGHGTGDTQTVIPENDIVKQEIERVTGVSKDEENSFDNAGADFSTKLGLLAASNDWPDVVINPEDLKKLVDAEKIWDLTEYIPKYCPHLLQKIPRQGVYESVWTQKRTVSGGQEGKIYTLPSRADRSFYTTFNPDVDIDKWSRMYPEVSYDLGWIYIWVRDDILKLVYPDALTMQEIDDLYVEKGSFTREQIFDVPIKSREDYIKLLYDMKAVIDKNNIMEGNKKVEVGMAGHGGDAYGLLAMLDPTISGNQGQGNYPIYYNKAEKKIKFNLKEPRMKEHMYTFYKLVKDGVFSKDSLIDSREVTQEKVKNGLYATDHVPWINVDNGLLEQQGKSYRYRKLNVEVPFDTENFIFMVPTPEPQEWMAIFKDRIKTEEQLAQILRYFDYCVSDIGEKVQFWGPKSAGLWAEENGVRKFTNQDVEDCLLYQRDNKADVKYGLAGGPAPQVQDRFPKAYSGGRGVNHPQYIYPELARARGNAISYYTPAYLKGEGYSKTELMRLVSTTADTWNFTNDITKAITKFNNVYDAFNDKINKCFAAKDDTQFEKLYSEMIAFGEANGLDQAGLDEVTSKFLEMNQKYLGNLN